ncbi:MAG: NADH-quinone oxidoreductase subunit N [Alphaproteobacteria bacterium]|uniref:NADH-quinone oxidoreductase subunit N n=1 Tax=Candidatus Nitrobium versatile TaxID=2884831 RepID=A0A953J6C1_9BACT|nr:NADH-quinone oxidoreductase subunit N [Candidatus Nitrobium versatile]
MNSADFIALLPLIVPALASVALLLLITLRRSHLSYLLLTLGSLVLSLFLLPVAGRVTPRRVTPLLVIDAYSLFFIGLLVAAGVVVTLLSYRYLGERMKERGEYYVLLLLATLGASVLAASSHFASFFVGLEILSVSLYTLITYRRDDDRGNEAGLKYLILAAVSSSFLLFGMALVYAQTGSMDFFQLAERGRVPDMTVVLSAALLLITIGVGFKLAAVPFHLWTPDVYEGAPAPVAAFIATSSKGALFALLMRYFSLMDLQRFAAVWYGFAGIAVASMLVGNLLALRQNNLKRILAYSSISHMGYLLVAFLAGGAMAATAAGYYLTAYFVTVLGAFGVITFLSEERRDAEDLESYRGMAWSRPWTTGVFVAMLLSLAGIPLTAGFIGKFYVIAAGAGAALWVPLIALAAGSTIGLYYYLRIVAVLYGRIPEGEGRAAAAFPGRALGITGGVLLTALVFVLLWLGVYPGPLIRILQATVARLFP